MDPLSKWLVSGEYLPEFMRDFHDQKDVFKAMHNTIKTQTKIATRVMVISMWLIPSFGIWLAADTRCKKSRKNITFKDMQADIDRFKREMTDDFSKMLSDK